MLSENQRQIQSLIETKLMGDDREALLFHVSVERKLKSVKLWLENVQTILPDFVPSTGTYSTGRNETEPQGLTVIESTVVKISAYIDAFFMSGKSTLDAFAHEIRSLYGLGGHVGNLYFEDIFRLITIHHSDTELNLYIGTTDIRNLTWYKDLKSYRRASAHESIIPIKPSSDFDFMSEEWKNPILKLPLDPTQQTLNYNGKNFIDAGKEISEKLQKFVIESYDKIMLDIRNNKTRIIN